ncbi:hypothetical protein F5878DRAFT_713058 [Lentinula raphanica]|uniref:Uncharacterized protein n=1 Tax=Lentinula raphanica TaxID=153919 RepID=A0AA38P098_9AGAR|nr:hypothetical protein F5880DRAFT_1613714 [Lentinula raphanica]KAJ3833781.1 hypothetical protein F5878DRAFT_713058 [Lentinula raphanica]
MSLNTGDTTFSLEREGVAISTITTSGQSIVDGFFVCNPGLLLFVIERFTGQELPPTDHLRLPVVSLDELCPGIDRALNVPQQFRDRSQFAALGKWQDPSGRFIVGLAITGGSENPWQPAAYTAHNLVAYVMVNDQNLKNYPCDNQWSADIQIFVAEPESEARERQLTREKTLLGTKRSQEKFPMMFELDTYIFLKKLRRYDTVWQFRKANVIFTIDWKHTVVRRPDVSGIRKVLEVAELMLLVCEDLDLRSVEALRQTCTHFRNMQPLADIGRTRMHKALARIFTFGDLQSQEARDQTVKSFNTLLHSGGSIVGGSTALHVLCPGNWLPADLDIVVRESHQGAMEKFLMQTGFVLNLEKTQNPEIFYPGGDDTGDSLKFTYRRFENPIKGRPGVDLCVIHPRHINAPADFVLTYHSTVVMNFWTGRSIYSLWPDLTINGKLIRNKYTPTPKVEAALAKYARRGFFDIHDTNRARALWRLMPPSNIRFIQDDYPELQDTRMTVESIPGPTWRKEFAVV